MRSVCGERCDRYSCVVQVIRAEKEATDILTVASFNQNQPVTHGLKRTFIILIAKHYQEFRNVPADAPGMPAQQD